MSHCHIVTCAHRALSTFQGGKPQVKENEFKTSKFLSLGDARRALALGPKKPPWVGAEMVAMVPRIATINRFSWSKKLSRIVKVGQHERVIKFV